MADHTPGPWTYSAIMRPPIGNQPCPTDANGNVFHGYSISGRDERGASILPTLAAVHNFPENIDANVSLIAAAPDLLTALKDLVDYYEGTEDPEIFEEEHSRLNAARAAIASAEGRTNGRA